MNLPTPRTVEGRDLVAWLKPWFVRSEDDFDDDAYEQWVQAVIRVEEEAAASERQRIRGRMETE